jgi:phosphatidylglycerophosphate synthase
VVKSALIFADDANGLQQVYGIPAVRRLVLVVRMLGFDRIHIISRDKGVLPVVSDLIGSDSFHLADDGSHLYSTVEKLRFDEEEFVLVLKAHHVVDRWSLDRLLKAQKGQEISFLEKGGETGNEAIFFVKAPLLLPLLGSLQSSKRPEADTIRIKAGHGLPLLLDGGQERARAAEAGLSAAVGEATWERDSLLYRHASRHVSRLMSPWIARTRMTANMVTLLNALLGLAGAFLLSVGGHLFQIAGTLVFVFSTIVDLVDGEVARLKMQETNFGHYLDIICDNIVHLAVFIGTAVGLYRETANGVFIYLLWFFLGGLGLCALILNRILAERHAGMQRSRLAITCEALFNNRDFAYLMAVLAMFHRLDWFFVAAAFGSYLLAGTLWIAELVTRRRKAVNSNKGSE